MRRNIIPSFIFLVLATACDRRQEADPRAMVQKAMQGVLVYPLSTEVGIAAGADAAQVTLTTTDSAGKVARWFRQALLANGWTLVSDATSPDGSISMSATQGKRPLWITLHPNVGAPGTTYTVIGAVVPQDSTAARDSGGMPARDSAPARKTR
ncbi:MAG TPA: hypothetical protein VKP10_10135 [Gemmatimonadales bacterium]|nr:hypothetical protein [Gemmatimonadales bacterium]